MTEAQKRVLDKMKHESGKTSTVFIQRKFNISYEAAEKLCKTFLEIVESVKK